MKKSKNKVLVVLAVICLTFVISMPSYAASQSTINKKYSSYLKKYSKTLTYFTLKDVDGDGKKEVICRGDTTDTKNWCILYYKDGKVKRTTFTNKLDGGFNYIIQLYFNSKEKVLLADYSGSEWMATSLKFQNGKFKKLHSFNWWHERRFVDKRAVSEKTINNYYNKYRKSLVSFHANTSSNRGKYLK